MSTSYGPGYLGLPRYSPEHRALARHLLACLGAMDAATRVRKIQNWPGGVTKPHLLAAAQVMLSQFSERDRAVLKRKLLRAWSTLYPDGYGEEVPAQLKAQASEEGVAPPGWERSIKKMKKSKDIDNPWALAWWMKNRGAKPAKHENDMDAASDRILLTLLHQQHQIPRVCLDAARGDMHAQAILLNPLCGPLTIEGRW